MVLSLWSLTSKLYVYFSKIYIKLSSYPSSSDFFVKVKGYLIIYNLLGKIIYKERINTRNTKINLNNKPKGTYIIQIQAKDHLFTEKLIIQ